MVVIGGFFYWSGRRFRPEKIARNAAKTMPIAYYGFEAAHPEMPREALYMQTLMSRPTFRNEEAARMIFEDARQTARESGKPIRLWMVVLWSTMHEYHTFRSRTANLPGKIPHALEFYEQFLAGIQQVIPEDV